MSADEIATGPAVVAPRMPLTITKGKDLGAASGYQVKDAAGRKYMLKFDIAGHPGMANAGEMIGNRIFHAAGYHVPGALSIDLDPADLKVGPGATFLVYQGAETAAHRRARRRDAGQGGAAARRPHAGGGRPLDRGKHPGRVRHAGRAATTIPTTAFPISTAGRFARAGCCSPGCPSSIRARSTRSTATSRKRGRHFVRHYFFDFGCAFGSATNYAQGVQQDGEYLVEVGRTLAALFSLGFYRRPFQDQRDEWQRLMTEHPALGYFPAESFDPDTFRTNRKLPSHMRLTDRDAYWGAKLVTAFSDEQIAALVATARLPEADARYIDRGLRVRRDIIGRRYLRAVAAVENPTMSPGRQPDLLRGPGDRPRLRAAGGGPLRRRGGRRARQPHRELRAGGHRTRRVRPDRRHRARAAAIASSRSAPGSSARRGTKASTSARRRACICAGATVWTVSSSSDWSGTNDDRGPARALDRGGCHARRGGGSVRDPPAGDVLLIRAAARRWTAARRPSLRPPGRWRAPRWSCRAWRRRPCSCRS